MQARSAFEPNNNVSVKVHRELTIRLQVFVNVLDIINNLGFKRVAIQTEKGGEN